MRYSEGFKACIVKKAQDGNGRSVCQVSQVAAAIGEPNSSIIGQSVED